MVSDRAIKEMGEAGVIEMIAGATFGRLVKLLPDAPELPGIEAALAERREREGAGKKKKKRKDKEEEAGKGGGGEGKKRRKPEGGAGPAAPLAAAAAGAAEQAAAGSKTIASMFHKTEEGFQDANSNFSCTPGRRF
ncbi:hypothetical protein TeGR_g6728 [Tetraparma gracilis]|uniref:Uncharacterized protein n=1 Tax=Tetraparma gracilis TaxID=2962635 RepID=A0ABQ6MHC2_9STRA|nr:hypothetical protein TeGR_g6728 [Tetraparma gracilis]